MSSHFMLEYYRARYPDYPAGLKDARYRKLEREIAALEAEITSAVPPEVREQLTAASILQLEEAESRYLRAYMRGAEDYDEEKKTGGSHNEM